jgi:branched-chain amino acid transport system permease protein
VNTLPQQLANGLLLGSMYGLIAIGYTMVYGIVQLINFAHGEIFMTGAFGALTVYFYILPDGTSMALAVPLMLIGGALVAILIAVGAERFAYRPLRGAPRLAPLITAIGLSLALQEVAHAPSPASTPPTTSAPSPSRTPTSSSSSPPSSAWPPSPSSCAAAAPAAPCRPPRRTPTPRS